MDQPRKTESGLCPRRSFFKDSGLMIAGGAIGGSITPGKSVQAHVQRPLKIAFVGCGRRARELADAVCESSDGTIELVAFADRFASQTQSFYRSVKGRYAALVHPEPIRASGDDCLTSVLNSSADVIYLATPPVDRPQMFQQIIDAGKHVFLEKPLAANVDGVMSMIQTSRRATERGLTVHVGFQRRYDARYRETVERVRGGMIGDPVFARVFCNAGPMRPMIRNGKETDDEFQIRNWNHFQWTGGDFLLEQHVAGLDVIRWALDQEPVVAQGQGGWSMLSAAQSPSAATDRSGEVFDHHSVEFECDRGAIVMSQCRRVSKAWNHTSEHVHGTTGRADLTSGVVYGSNGQVIWKSESASSLKTASVAQQRAFLSSIRSGSAENQTRSAADSTLMALLGLDATKSRKRVRMDKLVGDLSIIDRQA